MDAFSTTALHAVSWKTVLGVALSAKFVAFGAGWAVWAVAARTGAMRRQEFLEHVDELVVIDSGPEGSLSSEALESLTGDIMKLRASIDTGWHSLDDFSTFVRIFHYCSAVHARSTLEASRRLGESFGLKY